LIGLDSDSEARGRFPDEPAQIREVRGHGRPDLSLRGNCPAQPARPLPRLAHLHLLGPVLRCHQPVQRPAYIHYENGALLSGQEEE